MSHDDLADFTRTNRTYLGKTKTVFQAGSGPAVIVISEIPGITPEVANFARRVVAEGCTVVMPSVFGTPGKPMSGPYALTSLVRACVSREFVAFATNKTSPITEWLRALAADAHAECGGPGVGVIGMCFTGGFALAMMVDDVVVAPVLSQPSLPLPTTNKARRNLAISAADAERVRARAEAGVCVLGAKFTHDPVSPPQRFETLRELLGDQFIGVEIDSSPDNPWGHAKGAHSVVTRDLIDEPGQPTREALDQILAFFRDRLEVT